MTKAFAAALLLSTACLAGARAVRALELSLDTPRVELALKPGRSKRVRIKLVNHGEAPVRMRASFSDVRLLEDGSPDFVPLGSTPWTLDGMLGGIPPSFSVSGRSSRHLGVRVSLPESQTGGRYGAVLLESEAPRPRRGAGAGVEVSVQLVCLLAVRAKGTELPSARISGFSARRKSDGADAIDAVVAVANEGNVLIRPIGTVSLLADGLPAAGTPLNPARLAILPGDTREYRVQWLGLDAAGERQAVAEMDFGGAAGLRADARVE